MDMAELEKLDCVIKPVGRLPRWRDGVVQLDCARILDQHWPLAPQAARSCGAVAARLVVNRLHAPNPLDQVEPWVRHAGVAEVVGMPPERLTAERRGRVAELLGPQAPVLPGAMRLPRAKACPMGLEPSHGELTPSSWEGASEERPDNAALPGQGRQVQEARAGQERAQ
jgi:hypothetical protein